MTVAEVAPQQFAPVERRRRPLLRLVAVLFGLALLLNVLSSLLQHASGRTSTIERVGEIGVLVANPDVFAGSGSLYGHPATGLHLSLGESRHYTQHSDDLSREFAFTLTSTFTGRLEVDGDLRTRLDDVLFRGKGDPTRAARYVAALPAATSTDVVLVLARPTRTADLVTGPVGRAPLDGYHAQALLYTDPQENPEQLSERLGHWVDAPVSWPVNGMDPALATLDGWTERLRSGDDVSLHELGLPDSDDLKRIAKADLVYGVYALDLSPSDLRDVLADPLFETFLPVETRFDEEALSED